MKRTPKDREASPETYNIETRRLVHGPVGEALASASRPAEQLVSNILESLDRGEGWIVVEEAGGSWYPGRLGVDFRIKGSPDDSKFLHVDTEVVEVPDESKALHSLLNDLNVHAAGWWWWFDRSSGTVICSISAVVDPKAWWWPQILHGVLPLYATATESMADRLVEITHGVVKLKEHPERGHRTEVDGFILGTRLGARDMSASLDLWLSTLDYSRLHDALVILSDYQAVSIDSPLHVQVLDSTEEPRIILRKHWHPELGWGWQLASVSGINTSENGGHDDLHLLASLMNARQHADGTGRDRFGGWVTLPDLGLTHLTFIPAVEIDRVISVAEETLGHVAALMVDFDTRRYDLANMEATAQPSIEGPLTMFETKDEVEIEMPMVNIKLGPIGWPYLDQRVQHRFLDGWRAEDEREPGDEDADTWLLPRHLLICSFGIFNPMGPTVSSLEAAMVTFRDRDPYWSLFHVLRHPMSPRVTHLGSTNTLDDLDGLITESLAVTEDVCVLGTGPHWLDIFGHFDAVIEGARRFASMTTETDWQLQAMSLMVHSSDPWARISEPVTGDEFEWPSGLDPIEGWLQAITNPDVVAGHRLYLRSAWEGARAYMEANWASPEPAQMATDAMTRIAHARAAADYEFRDREGRFVMQPRLEPR
jgi:hypothetical protein